MKNLNYFDRFVFILNSLAAVALLLSYILPHVPPRLFPILAVLSLGVPVLIIMNIIFLLYWLFRLKRQFLLSFIILLLGYNYVTAFVKFTGNESSKDIEALSILSYNVRMFNNYGWSDQQNIPKKITSFIREKDPDIVCFQEFYRGETELLANYPYKYVEIKGKASEFGSAIFSKYPFLSKHSSDFPQDGNNNAIYVDILKGKDTLRVYNIHFQSLNIKPGIEDIQKEDSKRLIGRIGYGFSLQQDQAEVVTEELKNSPYPTIIAGDFNNTSFSYIYNKIKSDRFNDAFLEVGQGFGQSFDLNYFPLRIDFFLVEKDIQILDFESFKLDFSDHFPIMTRLKI